MKDLKETKFDTGYIDLEGIWNSLKVKPWHIKSEYLQFLKFIAENDVKNILEIGTHKGGSASGFLALGCKVTSVDIVKQPEILELEKNENFIFHTNYPHMHVPVNTVLQGIYDMLYIDAGHTYEECLKDYHEYSYLVREGGYIAFHDTKNSPLHEKQNCGVWKVLEEIDNEEVFRAEDPNEEWGGIVVVKV